MDGRERFGHLLPGCDRADPLLASQSVQNGSKLTAANFIDTPQTTVTVTSGTQTVTCATVTEV